VVIRKSLRAIAASARICGRSVVSAGLSILICGFLSVSMALFSGLAGHPWCSPDTANLSGFPSVFQWSPLDCPASDSGSTIPQHDDVLVGLLGDAYPYCLLPSGLQSLLPRAGLAPGNLRQYLLVNLDYLLLLLFPINLAYGVLPSWPTKLRFMSIGASSTIHSRTLHSVVIFVLGLRSKPIFNAPI